MSIIRRLVTSTSSPVTVSPIRTQIRSLSYFRAQPRGATTSNKPGNSQGGEPSEYSQKPLRDPMAGFSEKEVKEIKRDIEEQGRRAYSIGWVDLFIVVLVVASLIFPLTNQIRYAIIGGGIGVVLGFVFWKNVK
ncbi:hypothetical protein BDR26DRAFT_221817 [Obelidium mucronatum]|nr:hypothetical protein BDR26DRAFT_221817 [Obelidium mucronatum]